MNIIFLLHHYISIIIIFKLLIIIIYFFYKKNNINILCKKLSKFLVYSIHIQAFFGLILLIKNYLSLFNNFSLIDIIKINSLRYKLLEHPLIMLIVVIMTTLVNIKLNIKNKIDYKIIFIYIFILITLLSRIPIKKLLI